MKSCLYTKQSIFSIQKEISAGLLASSGEPGCTRTFALLPSYSRYLGKFLAFGNTLWLIASSLLESTGGYNNCWCQGNYVRMGDQGWIVLFKGATDLAAAARLPWGGGLALTLFICFVSYTFFFFGSVKTDDN